MRAQLERLTGFVERIDVVDSYDALLDIKRVLKELIELMDRALPLEVEPD